jgi:hypothetical protein
MLYLRSGAEMQKRLAIITLIIMSVLMLLGIGGCNPDLIFNIALVLFAVLMGKKGLESKTFRDVFNIRKQRISLKSVTAIIELLLAIEFVIIGSISDASFAEYNNLFDAVGQTLIFFIFILVLVALLYRIFFMNMFNNRIIDHDWFDVCTGKRNRLPIDEGRTKNDL